MEKILDYFGGQAELSRVMGVDRAAVAQWCKYGLPPARAIEIETLTGGHFRATEIVGVKNDGKKDKNISA